MRRTALILGLVGLLCVGSWGCASSGSRPRGKAIVITESQRVKAGQVLKDAGRLDDALAQFNLALKDNPNFVDAYLGIGSIQHQRSQYLEARNTYTNAVQLDKFSFDARYYLALMQQMLGETGQAISTYQEALRLDPDSPIGHRDLATAYLQIGRPDLALPHAQTAVKLDPNVQPAWCNLAATYSLLDRFDEALRTYRIATELGELDEPVLLGLGDTHLRLGNVQRAINSLQALTLKWPSATGYERLGYAQFKSYDFEQSEKSYRKALTFNPDEVGALNGLGACLVTDYIRGKQVNKSLLSEAISAWRRSLIIFPEQPQIVDLLSRYGKLS